MHYGEGFSNLIKIEELTEIASRFKPDVLLAGMQLNFEDYVAKGVAALSPKSVALFHPHEKLFERFRLKSSSSQVFFDGVARNLPTASIVIATPMSSFLMDGKDFSLRTGDVGNLRAEGDS
jgi:hypothetical protein